MGCAERRNPARPAKMDVVLFFLFGLLLAAANPHPWSIVTTGLDTNLRSISVVYSPNPNGAHSPIVWASGSNGVILRSIDLGKAWKRLRIPGGDSLDFRGIRAFDAFTTYAMSSGEGEKSRIYKTIDGGQIWKLQYTGDRAAIFLDAIACMSRRECIALSDPVDGKFVLLRTTDGEHWNEFPRDSMPAALPAEGAFAAGNTSLAACAGEIYFGTGGGSAARVFHSSNGGRSWGVSETPLAAGNASSGIFSIACSGNAVVAVGGDYKNQASSNAGAAYSLDRGVTWRLASSQPSGYRSAVALITDSFLVAVGPNGEDISRDGGVRWIRSDSLNLNAIAVLDSENVWAAGPNGTIAHFESRSKNHALR
jgi:photosystem II stability/assembly factor-like uncharacterized protein